jgi:alpha-N-arabinofuranosidase
MRFAEACGFEAMMCVNLGTGSASEAGELLEYCNYTGGTYWSDKRIENRRKKPYGIKYWCLGNEMDGDWQINNMPAKEYAKKARDAAKIMKAIDPSIKLIACGSSNNFIQSYPEWDREVLDELYDYVDYLSVHAYFYTGEDETDYESYLGSYKDFDEIIRTIKSTCNHVKAKRRSKKDMRLSFDEWNVWRRYPQELSKDDWKVEAERLECSFTLIDAVSFSALLCTLLNHVDRIDIACIAQLINVLAPIRTEPGDRLFCQTIYHPFRLASKYFKGRVLNGSIDSTKIECARYGTYDSIVSAAAVHEGRLCVIAVNTDMKKETEFVLDYNRKTRLKEHYRVYNKDFMAANSFDAPENVTAEKIAISEKIILPPHSIHIMLFDIL